MQARAARTIDQGRKPLAAAMLAAIVFGGAAPLCADTLPDFRKPILRPGKTDQTPSQISAASRCARYGEGFVPVVGSDGCVKIGGRLRIDLGVSARAPVFSGPQDGISPAAHLRVGR
jgi:hypothetical protein